MRARPPDDPGFMLSALYVRRVAEVLRDMGADVERWLGAHGLTEARLHDAALVLPRPVFRRLVLGALEAAGDPALGLLVGERLVAATHGPLGEAVASSGTLRQALELFARFTPLRTSLLAVSYEVRPAEVRVGFVEGEPLGELRRPVLDAVVLSVKNVLDAISLGACRVGAVSFVFETPAYATLARDLFGCPVRYGRKWSGLTLPAGVLDAPLRHADGAAFRAAAELCQRELERLEASQSTATRVRRLLLRRQERFPSLRVTARLLHTTPRTLHRHLVADGTSYRAILEDVRRALAVEHVRAGRATVDEIAYRLGYSDAANFRRAFRRWEGAPPAVVRARGAAPEPMPAPVPAPQRVRARGAAPEPMPAPELSARPRTARAAGAPRRPARAR